MPSNICLHQFKISALSVLLQYRIMLNGFGYAIFGVPTCDLETTWKSECTTPPAPGHLPLLFQSPEPTTWSVSVLHFCQSRFTSCMICLLLVHELYSRLIEWYLHLLMTKNHENNRTCMNNTEFFRLIDYVRTHTHTYIYSSTVSITTYV